MPQKATAKKRTTRQPRSITNRIGTMTGGVVANRIHVEGNWIEHQYNDYRQQIAQIATPQQFIAEAEKIKAEIAQAKTSPALPAAQQRRLEAIEGDVKEVVAEAKKDQPNPKTMRETLKTAAETMDSVGKAVQAAQGMGQKINDLAQSMDWGRLAVGLGTLADLALRVFGALPK